MFSTRLAIVVAIAGISLAEDAMTTLVQDGSSNALGFLSNDSIFVRRSGCLRRGTGFCSASAVVPSPVQMSLGRGRCKISRSVRQINSGKWQKTAVAESWMFWLQPHCIRWHSRLGFHKAMETAYGSVLSKLE